MSKKVTKPATAKASKPAKPVSKSQAKREKIQRAAAAKTDPDPKPAVKAFEPMKDPEVPSRQIVEILDHGHTETQYHVRFSDRTTGHVPKAVIDQRS